MNTEPVKRETIVGARRFENYLWCAGVFIVSMGFILAGLSCLYKTQIVPFTYYINLRFVPHGILMLFYGILGLNFSIYILLTIIWDLGGGYNEFDKTNEIIRLVRRGFPGKDRNILLNYSMNEIKEIEVVIKGGINPERIIYLATNDQQRIPLSGVNQPLPLSLIEEKAITLAKFLNIPYTIAR